MSTVSVTNFKNTASASNNLVLDTSGNTTAFSDPVDVVWPTVT